MNLTAASSLAQGLTHCNRCGECCRHPCLLRDAADVGKLARYLGKGTRQLLTELDIRRTRDLKVVVSPRKGDDGFCEFYDNGCTVHEVKPSGGVDFECWTPERTAPGRAQSFLWDEGDLMSLIAATEDEIRG